MSDVYSFTTTEKDGYLKRVAREASQSTNVILIKEGSTVAHQFNLLLMIRGDYFLRLAHKFQNETLLGSKLGDLLFDAATDSNVFKTNTDHSAVPDEWLVAGTEQSMTKDEAEKEMESVRGEIRRLNNLETGRIVRVSVESVA